MEKNKRTAEEAEAAKNLADIPVKRVNRELKYQGAILKVYQDTVQVNGHEAKWDYIHHNGAAAVVAVTKEGKLLMVRQYRNALDRYTLEIPAGALDYPEEPKIECAYRELEEETGFKTEHLEYLLSINTTIAFCDEAIDVFVARNLIPSKQHLDPDENIQVEEWELEDLLKLIYSGTITDGKTAASTPSCTPLWAALPPWAARCWRVRNPFWLTRSNMDVRNRKIARLE